MKLNKNVKIIDQSELSTVAYAVEALKKDIAARLGFRGVEDHLEQKIVLSIDESLGFDRHRTVIRDQTVAISGGEELGLIHGIYRFCEDHLKRDAFRYFTGMVPDVVDVVDLPEGDDLSAPYTFRHRGWFFNDEDLLVGFQLDGVEKGMSMEVWKELFELALRMECTCVIPGTNILADEPQIKLASDMGLYIAQHHAEPLNSCPMLWPRGVPYSWKTHKEFIIDWWKRAIERQAGKKVLWTLGLRGFVDRPFWIDDPNMDEDAPLEEKAAVINEALQVQVDLIKEMRGEENPELFGYLWGEVGQLCREGALKFPEGVTVVHTDCANAQMRSGMEEQVASQPWPTGVYQHIAMFTGQTAVRVNSFPPEVIEKEMKRVVDAGMTNMFLLNVANVRERAFGIRQMMAYANHIEEARATFTGENYYDWYVKEQLKVDSEVGVKKVAQSYRDLIDILRHRYSRWGDNKYTNVVRYTLERIYKREWHRFPHILQEGEAKDVVSAMKMVIDLCEPRIEQWELAYERAIDAQGELKGGALNYFKQELFSQIKKMRSLNRMVVEFSHSVLAYEKGETVEALDRAFQALRQVDAALEIEKEIEGDKFKGWHDNDLNCRTWKCKDFLSTWHSMLDHSRWMNLEGMDEGPQPNYIRYKMMPNYKTAYRDEIPTLAEI